MYIVRLLGLSLRLSRIISTLRFVWIMVTIVMTVYLGYSGLLYLWINFYRRSSLPLLTLRK
jgi:hypothetical protein